MKVMSPSELDDDKSRNFGFRDAAMLAKLIMHYDALTLTDAAEWRFHKWRIIEIDEFRKKRFKSMGLSIDRVAEILHVRLEKVLDECRK